MKTYGCSHNVSDSEYMQGVLASYGYRFTEDPDIAQLWCVSDRSIGHWAASHMASHMALIGTACPCIVPAAQAAQ